jgi:mono/diheme cytochrome c family protein
MAASRCRVVPATINALLFRCPIEIINAQRLMRLSMMLAAGFIALNGGCGPKAPEKALTFAYDGKSTKVPLTELKTKFGVNQITVDDHYFKRPMRYQAIGLARLLRGLIPTGASFDEIIFRCADGYLAHVPRRDLENGSLDTFYLAFGENAADHFSSELDQGKGKVLPEPFYAVATSREAYATLSWPYQVVAIELVNFRIQFPALFYRGMEKDPQVSAGFKVFRAQCIRCHSINLQGGEIGPELNIPRNITEYRDSGYLRKFIRDASSFRARSKMPPFAELGEIELSAVIRYLTEMRSHKIVPSEH